MKRISCFARAETRFYLKNAPPRTRANSLSEKCAGRQYHTRIPNIPCLIPVSLLLPARNRWSCSPATFTVATSSVGLGGDRRACAPPLRKGRRITLHVQLEQAGCGHQTGQQRTEMNTRSRSTIRTQDLDPGPY